MEKEIVIIEEKKYQEIKKLIGKNDDFFIEQEFEKFNAIFNATPRIFLNIVKYSKIKKCLFLAVLGAVRYYEIC